MEKSEHIIGKNPIINGLVTTSHLKLKIVERQPEENKILDHHLVVFFIALKSRF